ncbi:MAG: hypothetical protein M3462_12585, partial [Chloroflexota bacterium]|nr:hypothetical protein [Chloroflexota bacterium]
VVRERGVLDRLPHHTEADVYLWVMRHRGELEQQLGQDVGPIASATDYAEEVAERSTASARLRAVLRRILGRAQREADPRPIVPDPMPGLDRTRRDPGIEAH